MITAFIGKDKVVAEFLVFLHLIPNLVILNSIKGDDKTDRHDKD